VEVAHEALIRSWPQLRKWIDADRAGLRTRTRLTEAARDWKNAGRNPAYLYTGARLVVAKEWEASHPGELSAAEAEFLECSLETQRQREANELEAARALADAQKERAKQAEKAQRLEEERAQEAEKRAKEQKEAASKLRRLAWVLAAVALAAVGGAIFGFWQKNEAEIRKHAAEVANAEAKRQEGIARENADKERIARESAEEQARIAESRRLVAESSSALPKYPQRSLLLAVEALKGPQALHEAAVQSLREALRFVGGRLVSRAGGPITTVAISPDNRWLVTGSEDKTARLWLLQVNDLMNLARITVGRNFSADEWRLYFPGEKYRKTLDELPGPDESVTQKNN
jgi:WD domain, G-beta repeat